MGANSLDPWRRDRASLTRAQYQGSHPYPFLLSIADGEGFGAHSSTQQLAFHTQVHSRFLQQARGQIAPHNAEELLILPLRKAGKNPFPDTISVGRAPNCDVVIRVPSVSKLHGHFREVTAGSALFTDAKSANGTRVDGVLVSPGTAILVKEFSRVSFGYVHLQLLSAAALYDWLEDAQ